MQAETVKSLIAKFLAICGKTLEKFAKPCSGKSAYRHRKTVKHEDNICESFSDVIKEPLFYPPQIGSMSDEIGPAGEVRKVMSVEILEEIEDFFVGVEAEDFADNFDCKYFTISQLRERASGSKGSIWKEFFHKIISFTEDIYDKIIKVHFLALNNRWNYFVEYIFNSIGQRAFLLSVNVQKLAHGVKL